MGKNKNYEGKKARGHEVKGVNVKGTLASSLAPVIASEGKCLMGFTLAEVLIALAIIGVVAAMTIPSLMVQLNKVVRGNQQKVFETKLQKGMDAMNLAGEIGPYYNTTEDFIKALSTHMKIVTICKKGELQNCFPYESIQIKGKDKPLELSEITSGENFGLEKDDFKDVAGMVLADGTPMILSWNVNCPVSDPDSSSRSGSMFGDGEAVNTTACVAGIYDLNGSRGPNRFDIESKTSDVMPYHMASLGAGNPWGNIFGGKRIVAVHLAGTYTGLTKSDLGCVNNTNATSQLASDLGIQYCRWDDDRWAKAVQLCGGKDKLPSMAQLANLANALYAKNGVYNANVGEKNNGNATSSNGYTYQTENETATALAALGLSPSFNLWSGEEYSNSDVWTRYFHSGSTYYGYGTRYYTDIAAVCLGD